MKALIVGFGSIGRRHAANLQQLIPAIQLTVLRRQATTTVAAAGMEFVSDFKAALAHRPDVAVIASPTALHLEALSQLLPAGIPCYVEKPAVATRAQLTALRQLYAGLGNEPVTFAGCNFRFLPSLLRLQEMLRSGSVGKLVRASFQVGQWLPDWRPGQDYRLTYSAQAEQGGGVILDLIHEVDQIRWLLGEFDRVHAMAGHLSRLELAAEDTACALLGRKDGPFVSLCQDYVSRRRVRRYEFIGEEGTLIWDFTAGRLLRITLDREEVIDCGPGAYDVAATYLAAMREFLRCVETGSKTSQDLEEGIKSTELALTIKEAAGQ